MKILEVYEKKLRYLNYSQRTIKIYSCYLLKFLEYCGIKDPYQVSSKQIKEFLEDFDYSSIAMQNQYIGALKLFAKTVLGKSDTHLSKIKRPKKEKKLPRIIDAELAASKIRAIKNKKHKAVLALGLGCGLRISETLNLKWEDIDRSRMVIKVVDGKGKKDRYVSISQELVKILENYWLEFRSESYVFNGHKQGKYSNTSVQKLVKKYIHEKATYHLLRHSFATHAIDQGNDVSLVSKSLGHNSIKTTQIYLHLTNKNLKQLKTVI